MVGDTFLYNAAVRYMKQLLTNGELGEVYYIYSQRLNLGQVRTDINAWWNLAPHDVSILLYLMEGALPVSVSAQGVYYIQPKIEDVVFATVIGLVAEDPALGKVRVGHHLLGTAIRRCRDACI